MQREIPQPGYSDDKELWAFFGLTFYYAQVLEQGVVNFAVAAHIADSSAVTPQFINNLYDGVSRKTFGQLLRAVRSVVSLPNDIDAKLELALNKRNYLAHHFFVIHDLDSLSDSGRRKMIDELREDLSFFSQLDSEFDPIWKQAWHKLGVTQEMIDRELEVLGVKSER